MERVLSEVGDREPIHSVLEPLDVLSSGDEADPSHYFDSSDIIDFEDSTGDPKDYTDVIVEANTNPHVAVSYTVRRPTCPASLAHAATTLAPLSPISEAVEYDSIVVGDKERKRNNVIM